MLLIKQIGCIALLPLFISLVQMPAYAQRVVKSSDELIALLSEDKDQGTILLDGDWFHIDGAKVNMGGKIKPYGKRKPVLVGFQQIVTKKIDTKVQDGYWTAPVKGYGAANYYFMDEKFDIVLRAKTVDGKEFIRMKASGLQRVDKTSRSIRIKVPNEYPSLFKRNEQELKNAMLKVGYWFVQMNIYNLKSDGIYLYGQIDNAYNYDLLDKRPDADIIISFFNFPFADGGVFLDGKDVLHVPTYCNIARMCCSGNILTLNGDRQLTIEGLTFVGSGKPIEIKGSNKHIYNCTFRNCGRGVYCDYGVTNRMGGCSVEYCSFEDLYNNNAITFVGCDDVVIANNNIHNIGTVNKAGCSIQVGGDRFLVANNSIKGYSYIGIYAGISRDYDAARMTGVIKNNFIDNTENWGRAEKQLTDGGGIYVITHTDGVVIEDNIVRNIGYEGGQLWGIYLDDGAYNCTVRRNLVYNLWPGQYAMTARFVDGCERSCMNNVVEDNVFLGPCKIAGNRKGFGSKTIIRNNYISGDLNTQGDEFVTVDGNKFISATVGKDGRIVFGRGNRIKKREFTRRIQKLIK